MWACSRIAGVLTDAYPDVYTFRMVHNSRNITYVLAYPVCMAYRDYKSLIIIFLYVTTTPRTLQGWCIHTVYIVRKVTPFLENYTYYT